ncbi:MAG TPA: hypothetical protein DC017_13320, partial [Candidatus Wallbacteria bacterium]|nr:hypothetical protein [Candidatus Wallbacteria bacterium]
MKRNPCFYICFIFLLIFAALFPAPARCEDKGVGKQFKANPSVTMKPYYIKNIDPVTADSVEAVVEKEIKDNVPLQEKIAAWTD